MWIIFQHNPVAWSGNFSTLNILEAEELLGKPQFEDSEASGTYVWVSGVQLGGIYLFPKILIIHANVKEYGEIPQIENVRTLFLPVFWEALFTS